MGVRVFPENWADSIGFLCKCRSGCLHAGEGAGRACMNDFSVRYQAIDIVGVILSFI
jgi:hypothetical protein